MAHDEEPAPAPDALQRCLRLDGEVDALLRAARALTGRLGVQADPANPVVRRSDLDHALACFQEGWLTREQLRAWAEFLELDAHDCVTFEWEAEELIATTLFELSTPECHFPLSAERVRALRASLAARPGM